MPRPKEVQSRPTARHAFFGWTRRNYYDTPEWKAIRDGYLARNPLCYGCGDIAKLVHHEAYTYFNMTGIDEQYLYPICHKCHYYCHFNNGKKVASLEVARRLRQRRREMVLEERGQIYVRARKLHAELDERLQFLLDETI